MGRSDLKQKSDRIHKLLGLLRSDDHWTTKALADELNISHRTLMRDLDELKDSSYPIETDRGRGGGIRLNSRWGIEKINFTNKEAISLLLSLSITESLTRNEYDIGVKALKQKIANAFPEAQRKTINELRKRILIGKPASDTVVANVSNLQSKIWDDLMTSFIDSKRIQIIYSDETKKLTTREFDPHFLLLNWPAWYLLGWDYFRNDVRFFRIDRIKKIMPSNQNIQRKPRSLFMESYESYFHNL